MAQSIQALYDFHIPKQNDMRMFCTVKSQQALSTEELHLFGHNLLLDAEIRLEAWKARRFFALLDWKSSKPDEIVNLRIILYCDTVQKLQIAFMERLFQFL